MVAYVNKLKMLKKKAKPKHKSPYKNVQYHVSGVAFLGESPHYILTSKVFYKIISLISRN